jgi:predicted DNA-binding transcriptional regulator YafY
VHVTLARAARLHRLVTMLAQGPLAREALLSRLQIGLRTFYRELELLKRCGVKIRLVKKQYTMISTAQEAEGRLPFPDPQLSFAEMAELARGPGEAARRLAKMLEAVVHQPEPAPKKKRGRRGK